jgi:TPR repeat protein
MNGRAFWKIVLGVGCGLTFAVLLLLGTCTACVGKFAVDAKREYDRHEKALADLERACDSGDGKRCLELGNQYARNDPEPKPRIRAWERACELKEAQGCYRAGMFWKTDKYRMHADPSKAARFLEDACNAAIHDACTEVAGLYHEGAQGSIARDLNKARRFYQRGCDGGAASACDALAFIYRSDKSTARQSSALFERACELGLSSSCVFLAEHHFTGFGVAPDVDQGRKLLAIACEKKESMACLALQGPRPQAAGNKLATKRAWRQLANSPSAVAILQNTQSNREALTQLLALRDAYARVDTTDAHPEMAQHVDALRAWTDDAIRYFEDAVRRDRAAADLQWLTVPFRIATEKNEQGERDAETFVRGLRKGGNDSHDLTANPNAPQEVRDLVYRLGALMKYRDPLALRLEMADGSFLAEAN